MSKTDIYSNRPPLPPSPGAPKPKSGRRRRRSSSRRLFDERSGNRRSKNSGFRRLLHLYRKKDNEKRFWWGVLIVIIITLVLLGIWQFWYRDYMLRLQMRNAEAAPTTQSAPIATPSTTK
jgi:hypothetical protein